MVALISIPDEYSPVSTARAGIDPTKATYCWDGEGADNLASNAVNWRLNNLDGSTTNDAALAAELNYVWNATSTKVCTWDIDDDTLAVYSFNINTGYSGTITQASTVDIGVGVGGYIQVAGTFTGDPGRSVTCAGDFTQTAAAGTLTAGKCNLIMTGTGKTLALETGATSLFKLTVTGSITYASGLYVSSLDVDTDATLTIANGVTLDCKFYTGKTFVNDGTIAGAGTGGLKISIFDASQNIAFGSITCPVQLWMHDAAAASRTVTMTASASLGSTLTILSAHASNTLIIDPASYDLAASSVTIATRGVLLGGEGDITTNSWDSSAGTWTPETSNVNFVGTGTVKTAAGQTFYNLTVGTGASVTQSSNIVVSEWMELDGGAWTKGAFTLTAPLMTIGSSITATGTEDTVYSYTPTADQPISSVSVVTNGTWLTIVGTSVVGTPTNTEVGTYYVNVTCTNVIGSVSQNSTVTISNTAPVWLTTGYSTEWAYGMTYSYDPTASDEGAGLTYSMTSSAIELRCDPSSGVVRGKVMDNTITISLMADDGHGGVIYQNWTVTAYGFSWDGDVLVNHTEGQNLKVTFSASLTNATYNAIIKSVQWNFGDGNGSRTLDLNPMHPYAHAGVYTVTVYIVTEDDMTATKNFQITVGDPALVEQLEDEYEERVNQAILISGLACAFGLVLIACYIKIAGRRGWINRLVPVMIIVAMLAISATLIGSAMQ